MTLRLVLEWLEEDGAKEALRAETISKLHGAIGLPMIEMVVETVIHMTWFLMWAMIFMDRRRAGEEAEARDGRMTGVDTMTIEEMETGIEKEERMIMIEDGDHEAGIGTRGGGDSVSYPVSHYLLGG